LIFEEYGCGLKYAIEVLMRSKTKQNKQQRGEKIYPKRKCDTSHLKRGEEQGKAAVYQTGPRTSSSLKCETDAYYWLGNKKT